MYRLGWIYDFPDAYNGLVLWTCDSGNNNTNWCNKKYDALIDKATKTPNDAKRAAIYQQAETILTGPNGDLPDHADLLVHVHRDWSRTTCKGFFINPIGPLGLHEGDRQLVGEVERTGRAQRRALPVSRSRQNAA